MAEISLEEQRQDVERAYSDMIRSFTEMQTNNKALVDAEILFMQKAEDYRKSLEEHRVELDREPERERDGTELNADINEKEKREKEAREQEEKKEKEAKKDKEEKAIRERAERREQENNEAQIAAQKAMEEDKKAEEKAKKITAAAIAIAIISCEAAITIPIAVSAAAIAKEISSNIFDLQNVDQVRDKWEKIVQTYKDRSDIREGILIPAGRMMDERVKEMSVKDLGKEGAKENTKAQISKMAQLPSFAQRLEQVTGERETAALLVRQQAKAPEYKPLQDRIITAENMLADERSAKIAAKSKSRGKKERIQE